MNNNFKIKNKQTNNNTVSHTRWKT